MRTINWNSALLRIEQWIGSSTRALLSAVAMTIATIGVNAHAEYYAVGPSVQSDKCSINESFRYGTAWGNKWVHSSGSITTGYGNPWPYFEKNQYGIIFSDLTYTGSLQGLLNQYAEGHILKDPDLSGGAGGLRSIQGGNNYYSLSYPSSQLWTAKYCNESLGGIPIPEITTVAGWNDGYSIDTFNCEVAVWDDNPTVDLWHLIGCNYVFTGLTVGSKNIPTLTTKAEPIAENSSSALEITGAILPNPANMPNGTVIYDWNGNYFSTVESSGSTSNSVTISNQNDLPYGALISKGQPLKIKSLFISNHLDVKYHSYDSFVILKISHNNSSQPVNFILSKMRIDEEEQPLAGLTKEVSAALDYGFHPIIADTIYQGNDAIVVIPVSSQEMDNHQFTVRAGSGSSWNNLAPVKTSAFVGFSQFVGCFGIYSENTNCSRYTEIEPVGIDAEIIAGDGGGGTDDGGDDENYEEPM